MAQRYQSCGEDNNGNCPLFMRNTQFSSIAYKCIYTCLIFFTPGPFIKISCMNNIYMSQAAHSDNLHTPLH